MESFLDFGDVSQLSNGELISLMVWIMVNYYTVSFLVEDIETGALIPTWKWTNEQARSEYERLQKILKDRTGF